MAGKYVVRGVTQITTYFRNYADWKGLVIVQPIECFHLEVKQVQHVGHLDCQVEKCWFISP